MGIIKVKKNAFSRNGLTNRKPGYGFIKESHGGLVPNVQGKGRRKKFY